ncbi:uncharacterized protein LOC132745207 isoform X1 [Ruditapes philippinarum]|uniref:uncharacterized protein LOC132745207 isoform X1 n=1 Tax=Ruditapes philippinarum TaxID=129788 RepID=UPI00295B5CC5|nr:uncharacterized protein LOC132745207 isoform X1 [Ruditapes philippinarum]
MPRGRGCVRPQRLSRSNTARQPEPASSATRSQQPSNRGRKRTAEVPLEDFVDERVSQTNAVEKIQRISSGSRSATSPSPRIPLERLRFRARTLLQGGLAPNTRSTYDTALNAFRIFLSEYNLSLQWPISIQNIVFFISYCFERGMASKTITTYVAGLNYFHKLSGFYDISKIFMVSKLLEGCKKSRKSHDNRAPITKQVLKILCDMLPLCCYNAYETRLFTTLFIFAYFGLFRISELVVPKVLESRDVLWNSDISIIDNSKVLICLRHSKTNKTGVPVYLKLPKEKDNLCPVNALSNFLSMRPKTQGPLFIHNDSSPVTGTQFSAVLSKCVLRARLSFGCCYKTHSFRIGRATDLAIMGVPAKAIMKAGRWNSDCYKLYIR